MVKLIRFSPVLLLFVAVGCQPGAADNGPNATIGSWEGTANKLKGVFTFDDKGNYVFTNKKFVEKGQQVRVISGTWQTYGGSKSRPAQIKMKAVKFEVEMNGNLHEVPEIAKTTLNYDMTWKSGDEVLLQCTSITDELGSTTPTSDIKPFELVREKATK